METRMYEERFYVPSERSPENISNDANVLCELEYLLQ